MIQPKLAAPVAACATVLLASCVATGPFPGVPILSGHEAPPAYKGPKAAPQVAYRIDENRFFEIVPQKAQACYDGLVYYVDTVQGIRSLVMGTSQIGGLDLIIDAANTQYLVAPMMKGSGSCYTCGGSWLPYSVDGGRTWKFSSPRFSSESELHLIGDTVFYSGQRGKLAQLTKDGGGWERYFLVGGNTLPPLKRAPIDTKFHCVPNGKE